MPIYRQYFVTPPLFARHASMRCGNEAMRHCTKSSEIEDQAAFTRVMSSSLVLGRGAIKIESFKIDQRFSIGFKSGEFPGHKPLLQTALKLIESILRERNAVWAGAPSCMKIARSGSAKRVRLSIRGSVDCLIFAAKYIGNILFR